MLLLFVSACTTSETELDMSEQALSSNEHTAYNFFVQKGLTPVQAAGIVGNLIQESSGSPTAVQPGGPGRGIAQWSVGGRWDTSSKDNVTWYASQHGLDRWALNTQLQFIWYELTTFGYGYSTLKAATTVSAATIAFETKYEICGNCAQASRISYANQVLAAYGSGSSGGNNGAECYSATLGREMPDNACVQSRSDSLWYQCSNGSWVDRWSDPDACNGVYPL
ncbi:MAG: phage tail tip lysozyme [Kofleriaceae bacterium]